LKDENNFRLRRRDDHHNQCEQIGRSGHFKEPQFWPKLVHIFGHWHTLLAKLIST